MYTRVEFTTDVGFGPTVAAFVRFDEKGISFGAPYHLQVYTGTPEEGGRLIHEYQRVTVHADGRVETHLLFPSPDVTQLDQDQPRLSEWDEPWSRHFEFTWSPDDLPLIKTWFTKPKPETETTCPWCAGGLRCWCPQKHCNHMRSDARASRDRSCSGRSPRGRDLALDRRMALGGRCNVKRQRPQDRNTEHRRPGLSVRFNHPTT